MIAFFPALTSSLIVWALVSCGPKGEDPDAQAAVVDFAANLRGGLFAGGRGMADESAMRAFLASKQIDGPYQIIQKKGSAKLRADTDQLKHLVSLLPESAKRDTKIDLFALLGASKPTLGQDRGALIFKAYETAFERYATSAGVRDRYLQKIGGKAGGK